VGSGKVQLSRKTPIEVEAASDGREGNRGEGLSTKGMKVTPTYSRDGLGAGGGRKGKVKKDGGLWSTHSHSPRKGP